MSILLRLAVLSCAALLTGCAARDGRTIFLVDEVRYQQGDDLEWASPAYDDSAWPVTRFHRVDAGDGVLWLRAQVLIEEGRVPLGRPTGFYIAALASHEVYWDGVRIGRGGVVAASPAEEVPGPVEAHYQIPDRLAEPGVHVVAVRTSALNRHFEPSSGYWALVVGEYDQLVTAGDRSAFLALGSLAGMAVTGIFALAMFWINRGDRPFLLLALLCTSASVLLVAEQWRPLVGYTYNWHLLRLVVVTVFTATTCLQLLWLLVVRFPHANGRLILALGAASALVPPWVVRAWDIKALWIFLFLFSLSIAWTALAVYRRMTGALLALVGVSVCWVTLVVEPFRFADELLYYALNFLFVCLLSSHALEVRRERHERFEAQSRAARLQAEMLRRSIQPHFVMNALTAVSGWIEEDPPTAVRLINSLADEFRLFSAMADRRFVRLSEELDLCRSHIATMSLRKGNSYELEVEDESGDPLVPPAVVHTLVENAITHGTPCAPMAMKLSVRSLDHELAIRFESPTVDGAGDWSAGTGTKYIETRLRESYRDRFSFRQWPDGAVWRVELTLPLECA